MVDSLKLKWIYSVSALFITLNTLLIAKEFFWFPILPVIFFVILLSLFALDKLVLVIVFFTHLSIVLKENTEFGIAISLPTEPILFGVMLLFIVRILFENTFDKKVFRHPITIAIFANLVWMTITTMTSDMPLISLKFLVSRIWFLITYYFLAVHLFKNFKNIKTYVWLYVIAFSMVIIYTLIHHSMFEFLEQPAHWVMFPFYNDHTSYAAVLALFVPILLFFCINPEYSKSIKLYAWLLITLFIVALIFSYTRAAWVSLAGALVVWLIYLLRMKLRTVLILGGMILSVFFYYQQDIFMKLEKNRQNSSKDFAEHVQSISNITTDASNLERINRWKSALRMFEERPFFGWGPGTYQFKYSPYQFSYERTEISTNAGDRGNAHSEYIGPLAESGVFGMATFLVIVFTVLYSCSRLYYSLEDKNTKMLVLSLLLGLVTYFIHGALNNFLDTDKASAPFWGFIAMIAAIDLFHCEQKRKSTNAAGK